MPVNDAVLIIPSRLFSRPQMVLGLLIGFTGFVSQIAMTKGMQKARVFGSGGAFRFREKKSTWMDMGSKNMILKMKRLFK